MKRYCNDHETYQLPTLLYLRIKQIVFVIIHSHSYSQSYSHTYITHTKHTLDTLNTHTRSLSLKHTYMYILSSPFIRQSLACRSSAAEMMSGWVGWNAAQFTPRSWPSNTNFTNTSVFPNKSVCNRFVSSLVVGEIFFFLSPNHTFTKWVEWTLS
jgi:hypothetical protein